MERSRALTFGLVLALTAGCATAMAQSRARVEVSVTDRTGQPAEATVTLSPSGGGAALRCTTRNGRCVISAAPQGEYVVTARPLGDGRSPLPRRVPVPAGVSSIEVRVRLL